jgi:flavin reductase (DIM6/NTAB) family NADH-FMN oxidoreductase RutF
MTKPFRAPSEAGESTPDAPAPKASPLAFREGMSRVAGAVHIVTTDGPAGIAGLTMTAVTAVSDSPPTLLICVHRGSHTAPRLIENGVFCVNTLAPDGRDLAEIFAGRTGLHLDDRFAQGRWDRLATGAPVLADALASFDCRIAETRDIGTHHVIIGEVESVRLDPEGGSLVYWHRGYHPLG